MPRTKKAARRKSQPKTKSDATKKRKKKEETKSAESSSEEQDTLFVKPQPREIKKRKAPVDSLEDVMSDEITLETPQMAPKHTEKKPKAKKSPRSKKKTPGSEGEEDQQNETTIKKPDSKKIDELLKFDIQIQSLDNLLKDTGIPKMNKAPSSLFTPSYSRKRKNGEPATPTSATKPKPDQSPKVSSTPTPPSKKDKKGVQEQKEEPKTYSKPKKQKKIVENADKDESSQGTPKKSKSKSKSKSKKASIDATPPIEATPPKTPTKDTPANITTTTPAGQFWKILDNVSIDDVATVAEPGSIASAQPLPTHKSPNIKSPASPLAPVTPMKGRSPSFTLTPLRGSGGSQSTSPRNSGNLKNSKSKSPGSSQDISSMSLAPETPVPEPKEREMLLDDLFTDELTLLQEYTS